jgi:alkylhydroperoxidase family enzyme
LARRLGATQETLDAVNAASYGSMEPGWSAALLFADGMTPTGSVPDSESFATLQRFWSAAQIVEITAVIGLFNYFNRFANALDIPPTR